MADDIFETAHCLVALGGDLNNTVPRYNVPAGELAVLQIIHGKDALIEIEPAGVVKRSNRVEKARLQQIYGRASDGNGNSLLEKLYPGAAARIFQRLDELDLASVQFKPGLAPPGIDEKTERDLKAFREGALLADGTVDEDAMNGLDELAGDDEPMDEKPDDGDDAVEAAPAAPVSRAVANAEKRAADRARRATNAAVRAEAPDAGALS